MKRKFRDYQEKLLEDLKDLEEAQAYLDEAVKDKDPRVYAMALNNVLQAKTAQLHKRRRVPRF